MTLADLIPERGFSDDEQALDAFIGWVTARGLTLYPHQEEALLEVFSGAHVVLDTPTGSGKSLVATALHFKTFAACGRTVYTAPIKALVSEKFFALCGDFGADNVGMMTGDGAVNRDAPILCCTAEILANMALREGPGLAVDSVVMDEFHYYADRDRGMAWQVPLLLLERTQFLLMSATLGDTASIREDIEERSGRPCAVVSSAQRPVPLEFEYSLSPMHETLDRLVKRGGAPIYLVHFSQRAATEQAQALMSVDYCTKDEKKAIAEVVAGYRFDSPFGGNVRRYVLHGIGVHHAGLLPRYRLLVEKLAQQGLLKIICGTDTLGVGINVPIRTVLFSQLCKFDGQKTDVLRVRDFKQIAGRAGRAGYDDTGFVVAQAPEHVIANRAIDARQRAGKRKKQVKKKAPTRGYKHWDRQTFEALAARPPEPLESRFRLDHGRLLTMMQYADEIHGDAAQGRQAMLDLIARAHLSDKHRAKLIIQVDELLADLEQAGIVRRAEDGGLSLVPGLQHDFSLHHSLSLFLLDTLDLLSPEEPDYVLNIVSLVESILDDPRPVLYRQADRERDAMYHQLKAEGVPYEELTDKLREVSWPRPRAEWTYAVFNEYAEQHPWVSGEAIRPKSIVRDMFEQFASFTDYVKELGIQRSEGVLLRYLTEAYKALQQNIPAEGRHQDLVSIMAWLRAMLARVDASLVTEWETMLQGGPVADAGAPERPVDISEDRGVFYARVRAELHLLLRALALGQWDEAASCVRRDRDDAWQAEDFERATAPYVEECGPVRFDHRARLAQHTNIRRVAPHQWEFSQRLVGDDEDSGWSIDGRIDLRDDTNPTGPVIEVLRIDI